MKLVRNIHADNDTQFNRIASHTMLMKDIKTVYYDNTHRLQALNL